MKKRMLPPDQSDIDEAVLDGIQLVQQLGFELDDETARRAASRKSHLLTEVTLLSAVLLFSEPVVDGWKVVF